MILVTGGLGFIGLNTTRALLELGESCVLTQHQTVRPDGLLADFVGAELGKRVVVEPVDITDRAALRDLGDRHQITGIVHLAGGGFIGTDRPIVADLRRYADGLLNVFAAASEWGVDRVCAASTIGVYAGAPGNPLREDALLPLTAAHPIPAQKKVAEILADLITDQGGLEIVNVRIAAIWGPMCHPESPFFPAPRLVHAAVKGEPADLTPPRQPGYAEDGLDMCYVRDCARAIALLQTAERLHHRTYNVGAGYPTKNHEFVTAIRDIIPAAEVDLLPGRNPHSHPEDLYFDIDRLHQDTGYRPAYDVARGVAEYVDWLRAGHER